jgi:plastocyanin
MRAWLHAARLLVCLVAGCGGDGGGAKDASLTDGPPRDAAIDAPPDAPTAVRRVTCPSTPDATVMTSSFMFAPASVSINVNEIVKFAPENIHRVVPHATKPTDPGLNSGATGEVRCLQFTQVGEFNYQCGPHPSMMGVVQVTN